MTIENIPLSFNIYNTALNSIIQCGSSIKIYDFNPKKMTASKGEIHLPDSEKPIPIVFKNDGKDYLHGPLEINCIKYVLNLTPLPNDDNKFVYLSGEIRPMDNSQMFAGLVETESTMLQQPPVNQYQVKFANGASIKKDWTIKIVGLRFEGQKPLANQVELRDGCNNLYPVKLMENTPSDLTYLKGTFYDGKQYDLKLWPLRGSDGAWGSFLTGKVTPTLPGPDEQEDDMFGAEEGP